MTITKKLLSPKLNSKWHKNVHNNNDDDVYVYGAVSSSSSAGLQVRLFTYHYLTQKLIHILPLPSL